MIQINQEKCIGCGLCVKDCVSRVLYLEEKKAAVGGPCLQCGHCVAVCPGHAVSIPEYGMDEVVEYDKESFSLSADNLLNAIKFRRSIRDYKPQQVEKEKLARIVQAGRYTGTAKNLQDCKFIVIQDQLDEFKQLIWSTIGKLMEGPEPVDQDFMDSFGFFYQMQGRKRGFDYLFRNAPAVVVVAADVPLNAGLAAQNMEMMAVAQDLGILYNGYLANAAAMAPEIGEWLGLDGKKIYACMLVGYSNIKYRRTAPRREVDVVWK